MIKILIVGLTDGIGGVESFITNIEQNLDKSKYETHYLVHQEINQMYTSKIYKYGGFIHKITGIKKSPIRFWREINHIYKMGFDIVHLHECTASYFVYALPVLFNKKIKFIVHSHNGGGENTLFHKILKPIQNKRADSLLACSDIAAQWMFDNKRYHLIHNGIDVTNFKFDNKLRQLKRKELEIDNQFVIGSIARFERQKNHDKILSIFESYINKNENTILVLVGTGSDYERIKKLSVKKGLSNKIKFLNKRKDINELMSTFDVMLMPSLYEGLPFVCIEAQASSLPIVLSDTITEKVKLTELIYSVGLYESDEIWAKQIEEIRLEHINRELCCYAKSIIKAGFDIKESVYEVENIYDNLLKNNF